MSEREIIPFPRSLTEGAAAHGRAAHLIGLCGSGMKALGELLLDRGWRITGSDARPTHAMAAHWHSRGVRLLAGHRAEHVPADADLVVYSPAIPASNPERVAAEACGIEQVSYPQMLGRLMSERTGVAIAGTHGKSTTTAMLACILQHAGREPSVVCGAETIARHASGWHGGGNVFVAEACEYQRSFLELSAQHAAVLDLELDHFDCYPDLSAAADAFAAFVARLPADGRLVCRAGGPELKRIRDAASARIETFSLDSSADWTAASIQARPGMTSFVAWHRGQPWCDVRLQVPGRHNVLNALAAAALARGLGLTGLQVGEGLAAFRGIRRRFERLGAWRGIELVDDYAHHPTAVAATITAARIEFPRRRLWCAFQPHQVSRTTRLLHEFAVALSAADEVLIPPVYSARETGSAASVEAARQLAEQCEKCGGRARLLASLDRLVTTLETEPRPGDVILIIGAGDIDRVRDEFARRVPRHHAS